MSREFKILKDLCNIPSPSNYEEQIVAYIESFGEDFKNFNCKRTKKQSCYFYNKSPSKNKKTIMIDAHIDQVQLRVTNIVETDNYGYVIAVPLGFDPYVLHGNTVIHIKSKLKGNIVTLPPHLNIQPDLKEKILCIDFGMNKKTLDKYISIGDPIIFSIDWYTMNNKYIVSTGLDNKVSVYVLLKVLEWFDKNIEKLNYNIYFNFSSREEIGLGSYAPLIKKDFDEIIVLDSDIATDNQYIPKNLIGRISLDNGVVITHNVDDDTILSKKFKKICDNNKLDYQESFSSAYGGTNLTTYSKFLDSYTQFIGIPLRNMHSPTEVVSMKDLRTAIDVFKCYLSR
jgi:putative aminopeptidase FrvX